MHQPLRPSIWFTILLVAAFTVGYFVWWQAISPEPADYPYLVNGSHGGSATADWKIYINDEYGFSLKYPKDFVLREPQNYFLPTPLVRVDLPEGSYPGTNFSEAGLTVAVGKDASAVTSCLLGVSAGGKLLKETKLINGITFYKDITSGGAAGNIYDSTVYRTIHQNTCYKVVLTIHTGNIGNYPEGTVKEVNKQAVESLLNKMLLTFKFIK